MKRNWLHLSLSLLLITKFAALASAAEAPKLAPALQPFVDNHTLAGAVVLVANKDKILDLEAVGFSDAVAKVPMKPDALFWIASMTKSMTTTAAMMLVDEGKLSVDDPVEKYLPEFKGQQVAAQPAQGAAPGTPNGQIQGYALKDEKQAPGQGVLKAPEHPVTIRNLMTHTSGLPYIKSERFKQAGDFYSLRDKTADFGKLPLKWEPGTHYEYSNHGMDTLGRVIEVVSGMRYEDFMEQRLFKPLGMKDTTFWPSDEQAGRLAKAYMLDPQTGCLKAVEKNGPFHYPLSNRQRQPMPSGGLFSTATDISVFCRMLANGGVYEGRRYLSLKAVQQMTSTQTGDILNHGKNEDGYGFGWQTVRKLRDTDKGLAGSFGHGGAYGTEMWVDPQRPLIRVFMVQFEGGLPGETGKQMKSAFNKAVRDAFVLPKQP